MDSIKFSNVFLNDSFTVAGPLEKEGKIKDYNLVMDDYYYNEPTFEQAEIKMQRVVIDNLLLRNKYLDSDIDYLLSGDLSNQIGVSNYAAKSYRIPYFGVYSACATFVESLILGARLLDGKTARRAIVLASSHNLTAEKQFRFPVEYGAPKPKTTTFTATGSVGTIISKDQSKVKIEGATVGTVIDKGMKDATHMGAVMAPAAAETLIQHLSDFNRTVDYYDVIVTGDLGSVGTDIFREYLKRSHGIAIKNHMDAATEIYLETQEVYAGASGPIALPLVLFNKVLKNNRFRKILVIGTGSLHSPTLVNQKITIPAIAHAISLEVLK